MPKTNGSAITYIADCDALVNILNTKNNALKDIALAMLEQTIMKVPTGVLAELEEAFEEEFEIISGHVKGKIVLKPAHTQMVGTLASKLNSSFRMEPYGSADWIAAAVAVCEGCTLVTTSKRKAFYERILDCPILTLEELASMR